MIPERVQEQKIERQLEKKKMKILSANIDLLKWIGITVHKGKNKTQALSIKAMNIYCILCPIMLLLPSFAYFLTNLDDVAAATDGLYMSGILTNVISTYIYYSRHRCDVETIIFELQMIVSSSESFLLLW